MGIDAYEDLVVIMVSMMCECKQLGDMQKEEFLKGSEAIGADSMDKWKSQISSLRTRMQNKDVQKKIYLYVFGAAQDHKHGKKNVAVEDACAYWGMLLKGKCSYLDSWCEFMMKRFNSGKQLVVTKDTWDMFWELLDSNSGNL